MRSKNSKALHEIVAEGIIRKLEQGTAPWQTPWESNSQAFQLPYNAITGNRYKGINSLSLLSTDRRDPRWMTFKQASTAGLSVKKGEKASLIQFVKAHQLVSKTDEHGKPVLDTAGKPIKTEIGLTKAVVTSAWVFNAEQIEGIEPLKIVPNENRLQWDPIQRAEDIVIASGVDVHHRQGDRAYYSPSLDQITMPLRSQFQTRDKYYATLLHELGHWTGHKDRLNRSMIDTFGTESYAREELRAEIASMLIGQELNIGHDPVHYIAYVESWIRLLRDTPYEIHAAAADAEKITRYILSMERKREVKIDEISPSQIKSNTSGNILSIGDEIAYNNTIYKIQGYLKRGKMLIEDLSSGNMFSLSKADRLYDSLMNVKSHKTSQGAAVDLFQSKNSIIEPKEGHGIKR